MLFPKQIAHLKSHEAEAIQLRGLVHEQQRALRVASRQIDQLRNNERLLQDDLNKIRNHGYTRKQQQEMEQKWADQAEVQRKILRAELSAQHEEEINKVTLKIQCESEVHFLAAQTDFEAQQKDLKQQVFTDRLSINVL